MAYELKNNSLARVNLMKNHPLSLLHTHTHTLLNRVNNNNRNLTKKNEIPRKFKLIQYSKLSLNGEIVR